MAKTIDERIAQTKEKISQYENQMKLLIRKQKAAERKARTHRLIERGAILESLIDSAESLTGEQVKALLTVALNSEAAIEALVSMQGLQGIAAAETRETAQRDGA